MSDDLISILFVCLGNICRSPTGEEILRRRVKEAGLADRIHIESRGLSHWHVGQLPDPRMRQAAFKRGYELTTRAKHFNHTDLQQFDYILAADRDVLEALLFDASVQERSKIHLMTAFSKKFHNQDVPDPYYGGRDHFDQVIDMLEEACSGLLSHILVS